MTTESTLTIALNEARARIAELEKLNSQLIGEIGGDVCGYIITKDQIDAAVGACFDLADEYAVRNVDGEFDKSWERFFAALGTVECRCSQHNTDAHFKGCPDCHGKGWIKT